MQSANLYDRKAADNVVTVKRARLISVGSYVPEQVMENCEFEQFLDTSNEWIVSRTGIKSRHITPKDMSAPASYLGAVAARIALERVQCAPEEIDGIICATFTPDYFFPSTACKIQAELGCTTAFAFDVSAACAGFIYALTLANTLIVSGQCRKVLVVGAEVISKTLDWTDRSTCILFGDGAGAVLLEASENENKGIQKAYLHSDGTLGDILELPAWGENRTMKMKGNEVFKHAVRLMSEAACKVMEGVGLSFDQLDYLIPHQANSRIIRAIAQQLNINEDRVVCNVERFGNTSSASIPLALDEIWSRNKIYEGKKVLLTALGGGAAVGSVLIYF